MIKPDAEFNKITDISIDFLKKHNIKGIIIDVDNTLIDLDLNVLKDLKKWLNEIKDNDIKICIASNSFKKSKIKENEIFNGIPYVFFSLKPLKHGLKKSIKILNLKRENIAEIGDQILTDVLGSNRLHLFSILTKPLSKEKSPYGKLKRKIEDKFYKRKI